MLYPAGHETNETLPVCHKFLATFFSDIMLEYGKIPLPLYHTEATESYTSKMLNHPGASLSE